MNILPELPINTCVYLMRDLIELLGSIIAQSWHLYFVFDRRPRRAPTPKYAKSEKLGHHKFENCGVDDKTG